MSRQVFISYAHADNLPLDEGVPGWVSAFVDKLHRTVVRQSGGGDIEFWMDHRLEPQRRVDDELRRRIRESAVILAVMSPRYLESEWCQREMATFVQEVGGGVSADRVFMVEVLPTERSCWHPQVQDLSPVKLWSTSLERPEPKTLGWPVPKVDFPAHQNFWDEVNSLSTRMARQMGTFVDAKPLAPPPPPEPIASPNDAGPLTLLISTNEHDESLAIDAQTLLAELDADAFIDAPTAENQLPADYRTNFEKQLHRSHGVIVVYGQASKHWVRTKFGEIYRTLSTHRKGTWASLLEGPPTPKDRHGLPPRNLLVLDCKQGLSKEELQRFVQALRPEAGHV